MNRFSVHIPKAIRLARAEAVPLAALMVLGVAAWLFAHLVSETIFEGEGHAFDLKVLGLLRQPSDPHRPIGPAWLLESVTDVSSLGSVTVLSLIALMGAGYLLIRRHWTAAVYLLGALGGGMALVQLLKALFPRDRPPDAYRLLPVINSSFPSGHAALSAIAFLTIAALFARALPQRRLKLYVLGVGVLLSLIVGLSRIYLGVHWTTDVLAGWSLGAAWATLCWLASFAYERMTHHRLQEKPQSLPVAASTPRNPT
jgi:undecaprenyl-diphosphatase